MGVILQELVALVKHMDMTLVAGKGGMCNEISWTHMVDSDAISEFLVGQELAFTTGVGLNEHLSLFQLVKNVYRNGASGIVINIGPYVSEIPEEVLTFADAHDFPVFEVPWKVHMAEIMRIFCFAISKAEQNDIALSVAVNNAFHFPAQEELYLLDFKKKGYLREAYYRIFLLSIQKKSRNNKKRTVSSERLKKIQGRIAAYIRYHGLQTICVLQDNEIVLLVTNKILKEQELIEEVIRILNQHLLADEWYYMTSGIQVNELPSLYQSFQQAQILLQLVLHTSVTGEEKREKGILCHYEKIGMWKLLLTLDNRTVMKQYVEDTVQPLFDYDKLKQSDLVETLETYLHFNGSVKDTASALSMHRNTVNNKIDKVEELTGMQFSNLETRMQIILGLAVHRLLEL